jgi:hypothetical protein
VSASCARDFAVDAAGDLYVKMGTTPTSPLNNPPAWFAAGFKGAYQPVPADADDAGLVKIRNDGSEVVWATWIGGKGIDSQPGSVRVDPAGSPYMLFYTDASDLKTTPGAHDASHNGGKDLFLAKFSPDGAKLLLGTYLGGSGDDTLETHALSLDAAGNIYAMAITGSNDFPTTPGAFQESFGGKADVAVAKFDPSGKFLAATYVGGSGGEGPDGLSVSADGEVLFVGETNSTDFPVTPDAFQSKHGGDFDIYAARLSGDLSSMVYGSYFGGSGHDNGRGALFGDDCALYPRRRLRRRLPGQERLAAGLRRRRRHVGQRRQRRDQARAGSVSKGRPFALQARAAGDVDSAAVGQEDARPRVAAARVEVTYRALRAARPLRDEHRRGDPARFRRLSRGCAR